MSDAPRAAATARWRRWFTLPRITAACVAILGLVLLGLELWAEHWLPLAVLLFAPTPLLLLPLIALMLVTLCLRRWRLLIFQSACVLIVLFGFMTFRFGGKKSGNPRAITVITHNIGQGHRGAFDDSFRGEKPDAIILQDVFNAASRERDYMKRYPSYRNNGAGQFMLLTPHEIESTTLVENVRWRGSAIAARFVIKTPHAKFALYAVHLPTPRRALNQAISAPVALETIGLSRAKTDGFSSYREWLDARVTLARELAAVFATEPLPFIVGGDFNTPDHGVVYHTFAASLRDSHTVAGSGWGFTFPGGRERRFAKVIGHWLRLDYWFAGRGWRPIDSRVADDTESQHRALLARFEPAP